MARLFLTPGQTFKWVRSAEVTEIIGTNENETVYVGEDARATFDSSFNRGGDVIYIEGVAALYAVALDGSNIHITSEAGASIFIPVGTAGTSVNFADLETTLRVEGTVVMLGAVEVTSAPGPVTA